MAKKSRTTESESEHLEWLVRCRSQNQNTSLELYKLMTSHVAQLEKDLKIGNIGISLVAISFNLWRAVFLAEEEDADDVDHALGFLKTLISDNAIAYAQDRTARVWACRSYLNNARYRLLSLSEGDPDILPNYQDSDADLTHKQIWEHHQRNTDLAVGNYANALYR